jgi:hypothetical protein
MNPANFGRAVLEQFAAGQPLDGGPIVAVYREAHAIPLGVPVDIATVIAWARTVGSAVDLNLRASGRPATR